MSLWQVRPLDQVLNEYWNNINPSYKRAFFFVLGVNLLAFGFEMTNYTIHHDDIFHLFIEDPVLGIYLGRLGAAWLHYFMQGSYIVPFFQMAQGMVEMTLYGLLMSHYWGLRKTMDIVLIASVVCVFPYMAQVYTYNTTMAVYPIAHLMVAGAVMLSTSARAINMVFAAALYVAAFSIYQSVVANAAAIFCIWALGKIIYTKTEGEFFCGEMVKSTLAVLVSVLAGGLIYLLWVSLMDIDFGESHDAAKAFELSGLSNLSYGFTQVFNGTRSFIFWPENYFPEYLKKIQLGLLVTVGILSVWLPKRPVEKLTAPLILGLTLLTPRLLQVLHPTANYHNLTLTGYAVVIAGCVMIITRLGNNLVRNILTICIGFLISGYVVQSNWISTVNHLNTIAHYSTMTQILSRVRSIPDADWDGKKMVVFGRYDMPSSYPYKRATGVASEYIDNSPGHIPKLIRLLRDEMQVIPTEQASPEVLEYAVLHKSWPHPDSVAIVDGVGVVILSRDQSK